MSDAVNRRPMSRAAEASRRNLFVGNTMGGISEVLSEGGYVAPKQVDKPPEVGCSSMRHDSHTRSRQWRPFRPKWGHPVAAWKEPLSGGEAHPAPPLPPSPAPAVWAPLTALRSRTRPLCLPASPPL